MVLILKSIPIVEMKVVLKASSENLKQEEIQIFYTKYAPNLPKIRSLVLKSKNTLLNFHFNNDAPKTKITILKALMTLL